MGGPQATRALRSNRTLPEGLDELAYRPLPFLYAQRGVFIKFIVNLTSGAIIKVAANLADFCKFCRIKFPLIYLMGKVGQNGATPDMERCMSDELLWNFYEVQEVQEKGFVVVQRHCVNLPKQDAIARTHGTTTFHAFREKREDAEQVAAERNAELGDAYVPYPFAK